MLSVTPYGARVPRIYQSVDLVHGVAGVIAALARATAIDAQRNGKRCSG